MARKPAVSLETLVALGVDRLAELVLEGIGRDAAFKKRVAAALAGAKGGGALTALLDRRLAALERSPSSVALRPKKSSSSMRAFHAVIAVGFVVERIATVSKKRSRRRSCEPTCFASSSRVAGSVVSRRVAQW